MVFGAGDGVDPTEALWGLLPRGTVPLDHAVVLSGADRMLVEAVRDVDRALGDEAGAAVDMMRNLDRMLTSAQRSRPETCINSVRGPISWSETMTARANALGNEDVFVCLTSERTFDTVGNRLVVQCLERIARSSSSLEALGSAVFGDDERGLVEQRARSAENLLQMAVMSRIPRRPPSRRELGRLRAGRRVREFAPLIAFVTRDDAAGMGPLLSRLVDPQTRALHAFALQVLDALRAYDDLPDSLVLHNGVLNAGRFTFRHPAHRGPGIPGVAFRGVPLLPPAEVLRGAAWSPDLPSRGRRLGSVADLDRIMAEMGLVARS